MDEATRVSAGTALEQSRGRADAHLVCAYDDEEKCRKVAVGDAIPFPAFRSNLSAVGREDAIFFY